MPDHPSRFELECWQTGTSPPEARGRIEEHCGSCESCRRYVTELAAERERLLARLPAPVLLQRLEERADRRPPLALSAWRGRRSALPWVGLAAAACLALLIAGAVLLPPRSGSDRPAAQRMMGGLQVTMFRQHGGQATPLTGEAALRGGEALRFEVLAPRPGQLAVFFLDEAGALSWFLPPTPIPAGQYLAPGSAQFDGHPSRQWVFVVLAPQASGVAAAADRVQLAWRAARKDAAGTSHWVPPDLEHTWHAAVTVR